MLFRAFQPQTTGEIKKVTASERSGGICSAPSPGHKILEAQASPLDLWRVHREFVAGRKNPGKGGGFLRICGLGKETAGPSSSHRTGWHYSPPAYLASNGNYPSTPPSYRRIRIHHPIHLRLCVLTLQRNHHIIKIRISARLIQILIPTNKNRVRPSAAAARNHMHNPIHVKPLVIMDMPIKHNKLRVRLSRVIL